MKEADKVYIKDLADKLQLFRDEILLGQSHKNNQAVSAIPVGPKCYKHVRSFGGSVISMLYTNADQMTVEKFNELMCVKSNYTNHFWLQCVKSN